MDRKTQSHGTAASRFAYQARGLQFLIALADFRDFWRKAGFRPDQPRVPRGSPDGGQWTEAPGWGGSGGSDTLEGGPDDDDFTDVDDFDFVDIPDLSAIPVWRPDSLSERYGAVRTFVIPPFVMLRPKGTPSTILEKLGVPKWVREYYPHIDAYMSPAKTLRELQADARRPPMKGFDDHHNGERMEALRDGFPKALVEGPENLVRIPRFKHWEVTSRFMRRSEEFGGTSLRDYLRGRSWEERFERGLQVLRDVEVLK